MIILRAASILDVPYEWQANKVMASNAGLTDTEIDATTSDGLSPESRPGTSSSAPRPTNCWVPELSPTKR
jgi:hypothetical protein